MDAKQLRDGDFVENTLNLFKMYKQSWEAFKLNWQVFVVAYVVIFATIILGSMLAIGLIISGSAVSASTGTTGSIVPGLIAAFLVGLLVFVLSVVLAPLVITAQLSSARNVKHTFSEFFEKSKSKILGFLGLGILMGLIVFVGLILFIIPGLVAAFFLMFAPFIYIDKNIGVIDAMKASYELVKEYWKAALGLLIVNMAISLVGSILGVIPVIGIIGNIASAVLSIIFFCLVAIIFVKITDKGTAVKEAKVVADKAQTPTETVE